MNMEVIASLFEPPNINPLVHELQQRGFKVIVAGDCEVLRIGTGLPDIVFMIGKQGHDVLDINVRADIGVPNLRDFGYDKCFNNVICLSENNVGGAIWRDQTHLHENPAHGRINLRRYKKNR